MELEGKLSSFSLPEVLQFLSMGKMTGTLWLKHHNNKVSLLIKEGRIINLVQNKSRRLGQMLVESGCLKRSQLESAVEIQKNSGKDAMLGQILLDQGYVQQNDIEHTLRLQIEEEVWDLFSWDEGEFRFEYGIEPRFDDRLVEIDIQPLLLEGSRRQDEWTKIKKSIPDETGVVKVIPPQEDFDFDLSLSLNEWRVLSMVDGHTSILALCNRSGLGRFDTYRILSTFLASGIIDVIPLQEEMQMTALKSVPSLASDNYGTLPVEQIAPVAVTESGDAAGGSQVQKLTNLFTKKKVAEKRERVLTATSSSVPSPVGALGCLLNRYLTTVMKQKEFQNEDPLFLFRLWRPISDEYPKSDLVRVMPDQINVGPFERFAEEMELSSTMNACLEDTVEALKRFFRIFAQISSQRLGARATQQIWNDIVDSTSLHVKYRPDYDAARELTAQFKTNGN